MSDASSVRFSSSRPIATTGLSHSQLALPGATRYKKTNWSAQVPAMSTSVLGELLANPSV